MYFKILMYMNLFLLSEMVKQIAAYNLNWTYDF